MDEEQEAQARDFDIAGDPSTSGVQNARPEQVSSLLMDGNVYDGWAYHNRAMNRFFVANIDQVMRKLNLAHTQAREYFRAAVTAIESDTKWQDQLNFDYNCSHTQIYPAKIRENKLFGRAATTIVALEVAASSLPLKAPVNVYDFLRILPADRFVAEFRPERLKKYKDFYATMSASDKETAFSADAKSSFEAVCLKAIKQPDHSRILEQLSQGYCITKHVADALVGFLNSRHFPTELHVGPVVSAGEDPPGNPNLSLDLGKKNPAPDLYISRTLDVSTYPLT